MVEGRLHHAPSYPNWQRKRIQNPYSVSSNLTEGTRRLDAYNRMLVGTGASSACRTALAWR